MKRSVINRLIGDAVAFVRARGIELPDFATWGPQKWKKLGPEGRELVDNMLGWDLTDFGSGDFDRKGLLIFTFRNGNFGDRQRYPKPYAEKLLLVGDGQELPFHFHWSKMEDIINRSGGTLLLQLYNSTPEEGFAGTAVTVSVDGRQITVPAGGELSLSPGQSITLPPGLYHRWAGKPGTGKVMLFEVSTTNDDRTDNRFYDAGSRLPDIEEDEELVYLLFADYPKYVSF